MKRLFILITVLASLILTGCETEDPITVPVTPSPEPLTDQWNRYLTETLPWETECTELSVSAWPGGRLQIRHSDDLQADAETVRKLLTDADWYSVAERTDTPTVYTLEVSWKEAGTKLRLGFHENGEMQSSFDDYESSYAVRDWETLRAGLEELRLGMYVRPELDTEGWMDAFPWEDCTKLIYITRGEAGKHVYLEAADPKADAEAIHGILKEAVWKLPTCGNRNSDLYVMRFTWADGSFTTLRISDAGEMADPENANIPWMITDPWDTHVLDQLGALIEKAPMMVGDGESKP